MFCGGIIRGSSTLIVGPTGAGKSTLALQYACAASQRGDRAIVYSFDEVLKTVQDRSEALGLPVREQIRAGALAMSQVDPAELSPGEFIAQIRADVEDRDTRGERDLILQLHELIAFLNQKGIITFLVLTQHGMIGSMQTELDVSYLADTVIMLRYFEAKGEIRQAIAVLKQRVGRHERTLREFSLSNSRIQIGKPLRGFRGILTGVPDLLGETNTSDGEA